MIKGSSKKLPKFSSIGELVNYFEKHDLGEYWDQMPEAEFDIEIKICWRKDFFDIVIICAQKKIPDSFLRNRTLWGRLPGKQEANRPYLPLLNRFFHFLKI